jgi:hypothetical protein
MPFDRPAASAPFLTAQPAEPSGFDAAPIVVVQAPTPVPKSAPAGCTCGGDEGPMSMCDRCFGAYMARPARSAEAAA